MKPVNGPMFFLRTQQAILLYYHKSTMSRNKTNTMTIRRTHPMKKATITIFLISIFFSQLSWADNIISPSKGLTSLLNSMIQGDITFPKRFSTSAQEPLTDPDISLFIRKNHINDLVAAYMKQPIVLGHDTGSSPSTIQADKVLVKPDPKRNVLHVFITGGLLNLTQAYAGIEGKLVITSAEFELLPQVTKNPKSQVMLGVQIRLVALDIDQTAQVIDKGIANLLQDLYFNAQTIEALNLSDYVNSLEGPDHISLQLNQAAVLMKDSGVTIQISWVVK